MLTSMNTFRLRRDRNTIRNSYATVDSAVPSRDIRHDIQILRAVAVIAVVLYHIGIPLNGGFFGVDMFFTISGFVIVASLIREYERLGRISWSSFFIRRVRRLTPALGTVLIATLLLSFIFQSPFGMIQITAQTAIGASVLVSNLVIFSNGSGYFDPAAELNPLLHTWSLAVEEQFYLFIPFALFIATHLGLRRINLRNAFFVVISTVSTISLGLMLFYNAGGYFPGADFLLGFYGPVGRAWEFGVGALLALVQCNRFADLPRWVLVSMRFVGSVLIGWSMVFVSPNHDFPGLFTLLPVLGTACLIAANSKQYETRVGHITQSAVAIGDWSYSIYLWHWPFIALFALMDPENRWLPGMGAIFSLLPAILSYYTVENRFRYQSGFGRKEAFKVLSIFAIIPIALASLLWLAASKALKPLFSESEGLGSLKGTILHEAFHDEVENLFYPCTPEERYLASESWEGTIRCHQSQKNGPVEIAILGDSHAEHLFFGVAKVAESKNVSYWLQSNTQPAFPGEARMESYIQQIADSPSIESVILTAHWQKDQFDAEGIANTVGLLAEAGKTVVAIEDIPRFPFEADRCKYGLGGIIRFATTCDISDQIPRANREGYLNHLYGLEKQYSNFFVVETIQDFCRQGKCSMKKNNEIWYRDNNHLNTLGSQRLVESLVEFDSRLARMLGTAGG